MNQELEWFRIRDTYLGTNNTIHPSGDKRHYNVARSLALARSCDHPYAQWLLNRHYDANISFDTLVEENTDVSLYFAAMWRVIDGGIVDMVSLNASMKLGYPAAISMFAHETKSLGHAKKAAKLGDPRGFYEVFKHTGCQKHLIEAARRGWRAALIEVYCMGGLMEPPFPTDVEFLLFHCSLAHGQKVFLGQFCSIDDIDRRVETAARMYASQQRYAIKVTTAWTVCAKRMGVSKDMRVMISKMVHEDAMFGGTVPPVEVVVDGLVSLCVAGIAGIAMWVVKGYF